MQRYYISVVLLFCARLLLAEQVFLSDGGYHLVDDDRYSGDEIFLDEGAPVYPGTHLELKAPGVIGGYVVGFNASRITITSGGLSGVWADGSCRAVINGGIVGMSAQANNSGELIVHGGVVGGEVEARINGYVNIDGGAIEGPLRTWGDGFIELHGVFSVSGNVLDNYESLRNYGTIETDENGEWLTGTVSGRLADGAIFESDYLIMDNDYWGPRPNGDIIVQLEPMLDIIMPDGGQDYIAGDQVEIEWWAQSGLDLVRLEYSTDIGENWIEIGTMAASAMSYSWTAPQVNSNECLVRITDVDVPFIYAESDDVFTIYICTLESDVTGDCRVDMHDLAVFVGEWLDNGNPFK